MKRYKLIIHSSAERQMDGIKEYILRKLKNPQAAKNFLDTAKAALDSLRTMPGRIPLVRYEPWRSRGFRCMSVKNYLIYFWIDEEKLKINVIAVIYGRSDQTSRLEPV